MDLATAIGYCAAILVFLTFATRTMVPLRILGIASNVVFIAYGYLQPAPPILLLHSILLPLNAFRLHQMLRLIRQVAAATASDLNMDWLNQYGAARRIKAGEVLFAKGDPANWMAVVLSGRFRVAALNVELGPGDVVGELGLVSPGKLRTQAVECTEAGEIVKVTYDQVRQLYFQNPRFGFYLMELTTRRLIENVSRLEGKVASQGLPTHASGRPDSQDTHSRPPSAP